MKLPVSTLGRPVLDPVLVEALGGALLACVAYLVLRRLWSTTPTPMQTKTETAPKPAPLAPYRFPILYHTLDLFLNMERNFDWAAELCEAHNGRPFQLHVLGQPPTTIVNTPELFEDVLKTQFEAFDKGEPTREVLGELLGDGIVLAEGLNWFHQRKTVSNLFTMRALRDSMARTVQGLLPGVHRLLQGSIDRREPVDLARLLSRFTMEGFAKIGFGVELGALEAETEHPFQSAFDGAQQLLIRRFFVPAPVWKLLRWLNVGAEAKAREHIRVINETVLGIIQDALRHHDAAAATTTSTAEPTIVSLFLDKHPTAVDPVFLRDLVVNFLIAGRDTTAQAMSWLFYELHSHPEVEHKIREELRTALPEFFVSDTTGASSSSSPPAPLPSLEDVQHLPYLEAVIKETLRLHPSVPSNIRQANRDVVLVDGTLIRQGTIVDFSSYALGRATHVWGPDARAFRPERWLDPANPGQLRAVSMFQFNAFHAGPRTCLGRNLAMMEMKMLVASVLSRFRLELVPDQEVTYELSLTLPMKNPLLAHAHRL